ncbi:MAG: LysM peptidoglycan-binding domain-containing protein [Epsilonproteobacteria bacterium]|nr:LysM peptidoglycan-binding domain-containing protein [Campylobacterota bacterium]
MDIKKLLLKKKGDTPTTKEGKKIAKTEYLNNQVILENSKKKEQTSNDQLANVSTRLASLVQKVEKAPSNNATSSSQQSGKSVYEQRLAPEIKVRQKTMRFYVVKPGDTLSKIAKRFYGKPSAYIIIYEANQGIISNPRLIYPGQRLRIPKL